MRPVFVRSIPGGRTNITPAMRPWAPVFAVSEAMRLSHEAQAETVQAGPDDRAFLDALAESLRGFIHA